MKIIWKNIEKEINTYAKTVLKPISGHIVKIEIDRVKKGNYVTGLWISISVDAKKIRFVISKSISKKEFCAFKRKMEDFKFFENDNQNSIINFVV